jgi:thiamine-phosphate pyrophosphorylase
VDNSRACDVAKAMIDGGVDIIQLRGKQTSIDELEGLAARLVALTAPASILLIINDHAEIARRLPIEGVHLGQEDDPIGFARRKVGREVWIGKSTHSLDQALAAQREGADYIGFGPIFATPTKPDYQPIGLSDIRKVHQQVSLPIFCIGGIKLDNLEQVIAAGAHRVVIVSGILQASNIAEYARAAKHLLAAQSTIANPQSAI